MKLKVIAAIGFLTIIAALIVYAQTRKDNFAPADDFPRDALIYAQIEDLPALIKIWNESGFKEKYFGTANFRDFANSHLGRKMASRWQEFNDAAGFSIDLDVLSKITGNQAAIAVYDVGKLDFVFIAPISDEFFEATKFAAGREKFEEETLEDGTTIYRAKVEADRGRQKQELIFAQIKNRFVLATSEKLIAQTLDNINGKGAKNHLSARAEFKKLSEKIETHSATVWLDQTALNNNYYFKHYWLLSDVKDLKNIRAGIFDFEMMQGKFIERRKFLLAKNLEIKQFEATETKRILDFLPSNVPFYRIQSADTKILDETIKKSLFSCRSETTDGEKKYSSNFSFTSNDYYSDDYTSLSEKYDETIDDAAEDEILAKQEVEINFAEILRMAKPRIILNFTEPKILPAPLFLEFRHSAIISLAEPTLLRRELFESTVARQISAEITVGETNEELQWETKNENGQMRRELKLPMIGRRINYALRGNFLIISDHEDEFSENSEIKKKERSETENRAMNSLTVINFEERKGAFDEPFNRLANQKMADDFFTSNIASLLNALSEVKNVEIREFSAQNFLDEELVYNLETSE